MRIAILTIGKKHDEEYRTTIDDFSGRILHYAELEWKILPQSKQQSASVDVIKLDEGARILDQISNRDYVVLLDEQGKNISSVEFSEKLQQIGNMEGQRIVCIIGGAFGVSGEVKKRADFIWSLSKLVFPHQIVRLLLVEQIYRALTILKGEKYHHQ